MIPKELAPHAAVLRVLARTKPKILAKQIKLLSPDVIRAIKSLSRNVLLGNVSLSRKQKQALRTHKRRLLELAKSRTSIQKSRSILQRGGFLIELLKPIAGVLSKLFLS
jgi:hypothetical protein